MRRLAVIAVLSGLLIMVVPTQASADPGVSADECPEGYRGVIVGVDGGPWFTPIEAYACTNI